MLDLSDMSETELAAFVAELLEDLATLPNEGPDYIYSDELYGEEEDMCEITGHPTFFGPFETLEDPLMNMAVSDQDDFIPF